MAVCSPILKISQEMNFGLFIFTLLPPLPKNDLFEEIHQRFTI
jgi:hypothetical protein